MIPELALCIYFEMGNIASNLRPTLQRKLLYPEPMCTHTFSFPSPSVPEDNKNQKGLTERESSPNMLLHKNVAISV